MIRTLVFTFFISILFYQCARQSQPTGGPKDETPPSIISALPENGTRNYTSKEIKLIFDEDVQVKNARTQILITPRTDVAYEIKVRRNEVTLTFDSLLDANTTYTISFRESIQDLTEGNPAERLQIAFSTGPELDSLSLSGNVYNLLSGSIPDKATVVLYRSSDTTDLFTDFPYYFTETTDSGKFYLQNLKQGDYKLYAFNDINQNLKAESSKEAYGFIPSMISVDTVTEHYSIPLVNLDIAELRLLSNRQSATLYLAKYNKSILDYTVVADDSLVTQIDPADRSVIQFFPPSGYNPGDSIQTYLTVIDSLGYQLLDTLYTSFNISSTRKNDYNIQTVIQPVIVARPKVTAEINFTKPSSLYRLDSIYIFIDSLNIINFDSSHFQWNSNNTRLSFEYTLDQSLFKTPEKDPDSEPSSRKSTVLPYLHIGKSSFISIQSDTSRRNSYQLSFLREQDVATLILNIQSAHPHIILQVLNSNNQVFREIRDPARTQINVNNIPPGEYSIRAIVDINNNGKWDPGNFRENLPPEPIHHFISAGGEKILNLRANFVREETFKIGGE